ncbi:NADH:ubiquinone oxidoreductase subunit 4 (chain M) [Microbacterium testaceum]|uniref:NADH:ubiquinone oxidoreductase subunit 4 (chain M) n=1 Tax=Microbacterium testaceum TaxID=2033 RepID=UPI0022DFC264|nr:NADH:ubiquinone oxidoreductase subunit 4 (chain M) [Microbacterium testaceum]
MRARWTLVLGFSLALLVGVGAWVGVSALGGDDPRSPAPTDGDFAITASYRLTPDGALDPSPDDRAQRVWDDFVRVATPAFVRSDVTTYRVGDDAGSDTLAYVISDDDDPTRWAFAANLAFADDPRLLLTTLVHEYAHLLSLGVDDVDTDASTCDTEWTGAGCLSADSDLQRFAERFWAGYDDAPARDNLDTDVGTAFYAAHEADFVSDYAATNASEDFAETFATFVLEPEIVGDSVLADKFRYFAELPEYAGARERIRAEFSLDS